MSYISTVLSCMEHMSVPVQGLILLCVFHTILTNVKTVSRSLSLWLEFTLSSPPALNVPLTDAEARDDGVTTEPCHPSDLQLDEPSQPGQVQCWDPATLQRLGSEPAMTKEDEYE